MSTPPNKRNERLAARKASIENAQAARRQQREMAEDQADNIELPVVETTPQPEDVAAQPVDSHTEPVATPEPQVVSMATPEQSLEPETAAEPAAIVPIAIPEEDAPQGAITLAPEAQEMAEADLSLEIVPASEAPALPEVVPPAASVPEAPAAIAAAAQTNTPATPTRAGTGTSKNLAASASTGGKTISRPISSATKRPTRPVTTTGAQRPGTPGASKTPSRPIAAATRPGASAGVTKNPAQPAAKSTSRPAASAGATTGAGLAQAAAAAEAAAIPMTKRDQRRESRREQLAQVQHVRRQRLQAAKRRRYTRNALIVVMVAVLVLLIGLLIHRLVTPAPAPRPTYGSGMTCDPKVQTGLRYNLNVQIIVNGTAEPVPANVGIEKSCLYWLHTRDASGVIAVESPPGHTYELGDFFYVWSQTPNDSIAAGKPQLTATKFFGKPIDKQHPLTVYVDGKQYRGDPDELVLQDRENIWLEYGKPLVTPTPFDFTNSK